ncbi:MAG: tRNA-binding protein [Bacteroidales bacterium]|nr:tRNA-binding protein [Bacteroidales bacterium]MDZ4203473.1 tRNA-binding protein [Bacteroidales bacterium]
MESIHNIAIFEDFLKLDIRIGKIVEAESFQEARKPSYKLRIDFGNALGIKKSIAQLTANYTADALKGKLVICVVNFLPRQIGNAVSEVLTLGVPDLNHQCVLLSPDREVPLGGKLY